MLSIALDTAKSGITASSGQTAVISRNIANAGNALASRKITNLSTVQGGGVIISSITRVSNEVLTRSLQDAISDASGQKEIATSLERMSQIFGDPELGHSPAALIGSLRDAIQVHATAPNDLTAAASVVHSAQELATSLNDATTAIQRIRMEADAQMSLSVDTVNSLLSDLEKLNSEIVKGTRNGSDVTDALDTRDGILRKISEEIGIEVLVRSNNDVALFTDSGLTIFDGTARRIHVAGSASLAPGSLGSAVYVDGVPVTGSTSPMPLRSGRISGLAAVRDQYGPMYQSQLDEIARGLIEAFRETDQSAVPSLPDIAGLFTFSGGPAIPPAGTLVDGLAGSIRVNPSVVPASGGNLLLLRDGAIGDPGNPAYTYNTTGGSGFSGRLIALIDSIGDERSFDVTTNLGTPANLTTAGASSSAWLENARQAATTKSDYLETLQFRTQEALSRATGVNLDEEMTALLEIERSYQTSSKLLSIIDDMFRTLVTSI